MNVNISPLNIEIWMLLCKEGGHWTVTDLRNKGIDVGVHINRRMQDLVKRGFVKRFDGDRPAYGVTPDCKLPGGITLKQVLEAVK